MNIKDTHPFMQAEPFMRESIKPLQKSGITYFAYNKNYYDGSHIRLTTHTNHLSAFLRRKFHQSGNIDAHPKRYSDQIMLFNSLPNQQLVEWAEQDFNIRDGIYIIKKGFNFTEFFSFATDDKMRKLGNFYLNNIMQLELFCEYFKIQYADLIKSTEKAKLKQNYSKNRIEVVTKIDPLEFKFVRDVKGNLRRPLTSKQLMIVKCLMQGLSVKLIADEIHLSPRTIEDHILKLRLTYNAKNVVELISKLAGYINHF